MCNSEFDTVTITFSKTTEIGNKINFTLLINKQK